MSRSALRAYRQGVLILEGFSMMRNAAKAIVEYQGEILLTRNQTNGED
jgi:hypothetical protein